MIGRSVFVWFAFVNLSLYGFDAVQVWNRVNSFRHVVILLEDPYVCVFFALVNLSLYGFDAVQVWNRVIPSDAL